jgi:hypothetical protein
MIPVLAGPARSIRNVVKIRRSRNKMADWKRMNSSQRNILILEELRLIKSKIEALRTSLDRYEGLVETEKARIEEDSSCEGYTKEQEVKNNDRSNS